MIRKAFLALLLVLCLVFCSLLASCSSDKREDRDDEDDEQEGDTTVASSEPETDEYVTVLFELRGGSVSYGELSVKVKKGTNINIVDMPNTYRDGYSFVGWAYDNEGDSLWRDIDNFYFDTTLFAVWIPDGSDDTDDSTTDTSTGGNTTDTSTGGNTTDTSTGGNTTDTSTGGTTDDSIPHEHFCEEWIIVKTPTCTESGEQSGVCACGITLTEEILPDGHSERVVEGREPTCTKAGLSEGKECYICGEIIVAQKVVREKGHTEELVEGKAPTCTETGLTNGAKCSVCGETLVAQKTISVTEHSYVNEACSACGEKKPSEGLEYTLLNQAYAVTGIGTCKDKEVIIPSKIDGLPVIQINFWAFYQCHYMERLVIPNSVGTINEGAITECSKLERITIGSGTKYVNGGAIVACESLVSIEVDEGSEYYKSVDGNLYTKDQTTLVQYAMGKPNKFFALPNTVSNIGKYAFAHCNNLKSVINIKNVTQIADSAFKGCKELVSIMLNEKVAVVETYAFSDCPKLTVYSKHITKPNRWASEWNVGFHVDRVPVTWGCISFGVSDNGFYWVQPFYNAIWVACYDGKSSSVLIPSKLEGVGITMVRDYAFSGFDTIKSVVIQDNVNTIMKSAFSDCANLTELIVGKGTVRIAYQAFANCVSLSKLELYSKALLEGEVFYGSNSIETATIPIDAISHLSSKSQLEELVITDGEIIEKRAFKDCKKLRRVTLPSSIMEIGESAFYGCESLVEVCNLSGLNIQKGSNYNGCIGKYALSVYPTVGETKIVKEGDFKFYIDGEVRYLIGYCGAEKEIVLPESYKGDGYEIYNYAFYGEDFTDVEISGNVTAIGDGAFYGCSYLKSITLSNSITSMGHSVFYECYSLKAVTIPHNLMSIGDFAFNDCSSLLRITIPKSVSKIGYLAFYGCDSLVKYCEAESEPSGWDPLWNPSGHSVVWGVDLDALVFVPGLGELTVEKLVIADIDIEYEKMFGRPLTDEERQAIADYIATIF